MAEMTEDQMRAAEDEAAVLTKASMTGEQLATLLIEDSGGPHMGQPVELFWDGAPRGVIEAIYIEQGSGRLVLVGEPILVKPDALNATRVLYGIIPEAAVKKTAVSVCVNDEFSCAGCKEVAGHSRMKPPYTDCESPKRCRCVMAMP